MKILSSLRLDFHSLYTFYRRVQGCLCRVLLLVLYLWHSLKFLRFFIVNYLQRIFLYFFDRHFESEFAMSCGWKNKPVWLANWIHVSSRPANFSTRGSFLLKQTRATDLSLELAPSYQTSLIWGSKTREQKFCCATYFFARNRRCRRGGFAPGACCRSVLREQAPSCVLALREKS